jgi:ribose transport system permease protein
VDPAVTQATPRLRLARFQTLIPTDYAVSTATLLGLVVLLSLITPAFLSLGNFNDVARVVSIIGIMAVGMTFVVLTGGIDLSIGSTFALAAAVTSALVPGSYSDGLVVHFSLPVPLAVAVGMLVGAGVGFANGWIITRTRIEPFMATLGTMIFVRGLLYMFTSGFQILFRPPIAEDFGWLGQGDLVGVPAPTLIFVLIVVVSIWIARRTTFGRSVYAIGGNENAASLSGIDVPRIKILAYTTLGVLAGLSGIILASRVAGVVSTTGVGYELDAIAAVVIGGTSLAGGRGSVVGTVFGVFILGVITNALNLLGVSTDLQYVSRGLLLIAAVGIDGYVRTRRRD